MSTTRRKRPKPRTHPNAPKPTTGLTLETSSEEPNAAHPSRLPTEKEVAGIVMQTEMMGAMTFEKWTTSGNGGVAPMDFDAVLAILKGKSEAVVQGDMGSLERTAATQAMVLDCVFNVLMTAARERIDCPGFEMTMRMAFRAQSQCARTLETLAAIKNPAIITRQVNMANQQVVNNGSATKPPLPPASLSPPPALPEPAAQPIVRIAEQQNSPHAHERMD